MQISRGNLGIGQISSLGISGSSYVPVSKSQYIYSQFQYIKGVPAKKNENAVPLSRLRMLNSLVNRLRYLESRKESGHAGQVKAGDTNTALMQYARKAHQAAKIPWTRLGLSEQGILFKLNA